MSVPKCCGAGMHKGAKEFHCFQCGATVPQCERCRELIDMLRKLANEASGFLEMATIEEHGKTNIRILHDRILAARVLLKGTALAGAAALPSAQNEHELGDPLWPLYQEYASMVPPKGTPQFTYSGWLGRLAARLINERNTPKMASKEPK